MKFSKRMDRFGQGILPRFWRKSAGCCRLGAGGRLKRRYAQYSAGAACDRRAGAAAADPHSYAIQDTDELKEAVAAWYRRRYGVILDPQREVASLLGSQEGLSHIAFSIVDEGDVVLVPDPCYPIFGDGPALAGARLASLPQRRENGYLIDFDEIPEGYARAG